MKKRERSGSKKASNRVKMELKTSLMKNLLAYLLGETRSRNFVKKLNIFFQLVDETVYLSDADMEMPYAAVRRVLKTILEDNVDDQELIMDRLLSMPKYEEEMPDLIEEIGDIDMNEDLVVYIENEFIDRLNYVTAIPVISQLKTVISQFDKQEYESYNEIIQEIRGYTSIFNKAVNLRSSASLTYPEIDFNSEQFDVILEKVYKNLTNEKKYLMTGIKDLNAMLQGGFQPGRVYVFMAVSGGWKSGLLLNAFIWAARYNRNLRCRDQAKKPMFLYLTHMGALHGNVHRKLF